MNVALCDSCKESLVEQLKERIESNGNKVKSIDPYVSSNTPNVELTYIDEDTGREYTELIEADANYCCECGSKL